VATCPDAIQYSRIFGFPIQAQKGVTGKTVRDVDLLWEVLHYSQKAIAEDRPDEAIFRPDAPQPESEFV
jgi:hypothetical protein